MNSNSGTMKYVSFKGAKNYDGPPKVGFAALASPGQVVTVSTSEGFNSDHNHTLAVSCSVSNLSGGSAQLTIFFAGSVCVYNDVSPEKAQAIMLLAGNENSSTNPPKKTSSSANTVASRAETQTHKPFGGASGFHFINKMSDDHTTSLCLSAIPSPNPISVSIPWNARSGVRDDLGNSPRNITPFSSRNFPRPISLSSASSRGFPDPAASRSLASVAAPINKPEPSIPSISQGARVSSKTTITAVPQFRKASLARFLKKRKERAVTAAPYPNPGKKSPDCATPQSESRSFSITSGSCLSLSSIK